MKIISNFILVFALCATVKYITIEQLKLKDYESLINKIIYGIQILVFIRILFRFLKS